MSMGPLGVASSVSGSLPQIRSADAGRAEKQSADQSRRATSEKHAEAAAGVGETTQDEKASDRDADGHRMWEASAEGDAKAEDGSEATNPSETPKSKDPTGTSGGQLDLSG